MTINQSYYPQTPETELLAAAAGGDAVAFHELYRRHFTNAYSAALSFLKSREAAEDLLQDIFINLWEKKDTLNNIRELAPYLNVVVRNRLVSALRTKERQEKIRSGLRLEPLTLTTPQQQAEFTGLKQLIAQALLQLPEQSRRMYALSREENLTHDEIGRQIGVSPKTVANTLTLVLNHLRHFLARHGYLVFILFL
ncbi:MAG: sigma-70 family RNA polymerase sigma factor [Bacteroidota bacterium]